MKRLYIVRHAKSSWADLSLRDVDRPLNARGNRDAPVMAKKVQNADAHIDALYCSISQRTRETAAHFKGGLTFGSIDYLDKIYHAPYEQLIEVIYDIPADKNTAMIIAHNPGSTDLYNHYADDYLDNLPTCGIFLIQINGEWTDADQQHTTVSHLMYPKMFL